MKTLLLLVALLAVLSGCELRGHFKSKPSPPPKPNLIEAKERLDSEATQRRIEEKLDNIHKLIDKGLL